MNIHCLVNKKKNYKLAQYKGKSEPTSSFEAMLDFTLSSSQDVRMGFSNTVNGETKSDGENFSVIKSTLYHKYFLHTWKVLHHGQ